jgi:hypothetical protein
MARGQRNPDLERQWRERVARWSASGLSVREFCLQHALIETSFYYWKRELQARDASVTSSTVSAPPSRASSPAIAPAKSPARDPTMVPEYPCHPPNGLNRTTVQAKRGYAAWA